MITSARRNRLASGRPASAAARTTQRDSRVVGASRSLAEALERRVLLSTTIAAPTHLVATNDGYIDANLSWQDVSGAIGYIVEQAPAGTGHFAVVDQPMYPSAVENDVQPTGRYDFRVRAVAQDGTVSVPSAVATVLVPLQAPAFVPPGPVAVSPSRVDLTWDMGEDPPSSVEINRSTDGVHFARVALMPPGTLRYSDTSVSEGTGYLYELRAIDGGFTSQWTDPIPVSTPPAAPAGLTARAYSTSEVDLSWRNVSRHAQSVTIVRSDSSGNDQFESLLPSTTTYRDTGLDANHTYRYYVTSTDSTGTNSDPSNIVTVTTPPASVTGLSANSVSTSEIDLSWTGAVRGATGIEVDVSTNGQTYHPAATLPASARSYRSTGLLSDAHYWYEVRALRSAGPGAFSPIDAYTLVPAPFNLRARLDGLRNVDLTWQSNDPRGTAFDLQWADNPQFITLVGDVTVTSTSFQSEFTQAGETQWYRVVALNANQNPSAASNVVSITAPSPWPGTPDPTFGQSGEAGEVFPGSYAQAVAIAPDGKIVVASGAYSLLLARYNADGTLDHSFASYGRLVTGWGDAQTSDSLLVQGDGKIVVTGSDNAGRLIVARYLVSGAPDPSFGKGGAVVLNSVLASPDSAVALQPDGKIVVAGVVAQGSMFSCTVTRLTPRGAPDSTFGSGDTVLTPFGSAVFGVGAVRILPGGKIIVGAGDSVVRYTSTGSLDRSFGSGGFAQGFPYEGVLDAIAQPDGKLLVAADRSVTRLLPNGKADPSFGDQGTSDADGNGNLVLEPDGTILQVGSFGAPLEAFTASGMTDEAFGFRGFVDVPLEFNAYAAARQPDGRIVVVGAGRVPGFTVVRYLPNGSLDPSFGYFGFSQVPDGLNGGVGTVAAQHDGKVLAAGSEVNPDPNLPNVAGLVRYNSDGTLDTTFGRHGRAYLRIGHQAIFDTMAVEPNGDIVVGGSGEVRGVQVFVVARFLSSGFLDPTFGTNGVVTSTFGGSGTQQCTSLAVQGNGDVVAVGSNDHQIVAERLLPSGALDPRFGTGGIVLLNPGGKPASAGAMAIQSDGRIVIGGTVNGNFGVIRLTSGGALDPTFGNGGIVRTVIAGGSSAAALVLDRQGRIVVGGTSGIAGLPTVARYLSNGRLDTTFGAGGIMRSTDPNGFTGETVTNLALDLQGRLIARLASPNGDVVVRLTDPGPDPEFIESFLGTSDTFPPVGGLAIDSSGKILAGALGVWRLND